MSRKSPEVDAYIENAPEYARPVLKRLRRVFLRASPRIEETIKWGTPHYVHQGIVAGMAAFKRHVAFGFWRAPEMEDPERLFGGEPKASPFRVKATSVADLPSDAVLLAYAREAVALNEQGAPRRKPAAPRPRKEVAVPADLKAALARSKKARAAFDAFPPSHRREYVEWIEEAKREETRARRLAQAVAWMAEGKSRNWQYRP